MSFAGNVLSNSLRSLKMKISAVGPNRVKKKAIRNVSI